MNGYKYGDPLVHQRGGRRGKTGPHGETRDEVYLEEAADIKAPTKAENTKGRFTRQ